jgi:hypothetical protein
MSNGELTWIDNILFTFTSQIMLEDLKTVAQQIHTNLEIKFLKKWFNYRNKDK